MHTPGPWRYSRWWDQFDWDNSDEEGRANLLSAPVTTIETADGRTSVMRCHDLASIREADALLIAAAPDLLAALILLVDDEEGEPGSPLWIAQAAIDRAKGE